jgi:SAM-dependent methyltransferase
VPIAAPGVHEAAMALVEKYVPSGALIADLCGGNGAFSLWLVDANYSVVAADIDPRGFAVPNVPFYALDLDEPFSQKLGCCLYDSVVALEGVEHLENPWKFLRECRRMIKPDGILILSSPNVECTLSRIVFLMTGGLLTFDKTMTNPSHITPIFSWLLNHALGRAGFRVIETVFAAEGWAAHHSWKYWLASKVQWLIYPFLGGAERGEIRLVVAKAAES